MAKKNNFFKTNKRDNNVSGEVKKAGEVKSDQAKKAAEEDKKDDKRSLKDIKVELKEIQDKLKVIIDKNKDAKKSNNADEEYLELKINETNLKLEQESLRHRNFVNRNKKAIKKFEKLKKSITLKKIEEIQKEKNISSEELVRAVERI